MSKVSICEVAIKVGSFCKFFGFAVFSVVDGKVKVTIFDKICFILNFLFIIALGYFGIYYQFSSFEDSILAAMGTCVAAAGGTLSSFFSMTITLYFRHDIWKLITLLDNMTNTFMGLTMIFSYLLSLQISLINETLSLKSIHLDCIKCVQLINKIFGVLALGSVATDFLVSIFSNFVAFKAFYFNDVNKTYAVECLCFGIFLKYTVMFMLYACNRVSSESKRLQTSISKLSFKEDYSILQLQAFGNQVKNLPVKLTCGLFDFDYSLVMMMISSVCTYLLIVIQFEISAQQQSFKT
ncbi:CLUMA_CG005394, isoform A [Clunio marinus]|uniref:Gustatory receptor n=1 Tax=Clunio marinus TaxID=568069 RepID=A0A1J1HUL1_9DIPT|nr:CLUMA_CG005394, isoform A [Clunio marinus]